MSECVLIFVNPPTGFTPSLRALEFNCSELGTDGRKLRGKDEKLANAMIILEQSNLRRARAMIHDRHAHVLGKVAHQHARWRREQFSGREGRAGVANH